jgi:hypothetical protein
MCLFAHIFRKYRTPNQNKSSRRGGRRNKSSRAAFQIEKAGDQIVKRMTYGGELVTGAGVVIPITSFTSAEVQSVPASEWASFAARYQQYRVRAIRVTGKTTQPVQLAAISHSILYRGDYLGASVPASSAQVLSDENVKECATYRDFRDIVTWKKNPNAKLWNPTNAAIPAANQFSWVCASPALPALTTGTTYYAIVVEYEVEFRGSQ